MQLGMADSGEKNPNLGQRATDKLFVDALNM
jgi:hypothetical protein